MRKYCFILLLLIAGISFNPENLLAAKAKGYVVNLDNDTVYGEVKINKYNINSSGYVINGIDLEWFYSEVRFKENDCRRYKVFLPDSIVSFGFTYRGNEYIFRSFNLQHKRLSTHIGQPRFLNLVYSGNLKLYRNIYYVQHPASNLNPSLFGNRSLYYDFYLYNNLIGLKKVECCKETKTVAELLSIYDVDREFINSISPEVKFKDIRMILEQYDDWLSKDELKKSFVLLQ